MRIAYRRDRRFGFYGELLELTRDITSDAPLTNLYRFFPRNLSNGKPLPGPLPKRTAASMA